MKLFLIGFCFAFLVCGCDDDDRHMNKIKCYSYTSNVREVDGGYIMYDIERGTVTCREHKKRAELACWNKKRL